MNILPIEYFLALARHKSFRRTAEAFFVSPSAISMQISKLEQAWGVKLFERKYRSVSLTPAGKLLYDVLSTAEADFKTALEDARKMNQNEGSVVVIGVPEYADLGNFLDIVVSYEQAHPGVTAKIVSCSLDALLLPKAKRFDLIVSLGYPPKSKQKLNSLILAYRHKAAFLSPSHPLLQKNARPEPADLKDQPIYAPASGSDGILAAHCREDCLREGFLPKEIVIMPNVASMLLEVQMGHGVALLDDLITLPGSMGLTSLPFHHSFPVYLSWPGAPDKPFLRELAEQLRAGTNLLSHDPS